MKIRPVFPVQEPNAFSVPHDIPEGRPPVPETRLMELSERPPCRMKDMQFLRLRPVGEKPMLYRRPAVFQHHVIVCQEEYLRRAVREFCRNGNTGDLIIKFSFRRVLHGLYAVIALLFLDPEFFSFPEKRDHPLPGMRVDAFFRGAEKTLLIHHNCFPFPAAQRTVSYGHCMIPPNSNTSVYPRSASFSAPFLLRTPLRQ